MNPFNLGIGIRGCLCRLCGRIWEWLEGMEPVRSCGYCVGLRIPGWRSGLLRGTIETETVPMLQYSVEHCIVWPLLQANDKASPNL